MQAKKKRDAAVSDAKREADRKQIEGSGGLGSTSMDTDDVGGGDLLASKDEDVIF